MDIKVEITHLQELEAALSKCPDAIKRNLKLAMLVSLRNIQRRARQEHNFRSRSGNLERSIDTEIINEWPLKGRVFLNQTLTKTDDGGSYGVYVHEGTPPHEIAPKNVYPTCVGMNRIMPEPRQNGRGIPHMRGDEPN